jgi:photosystem II stability/assembly factor-like uncharacterized protein
MTLHEPDGYLAWRCIGPVRAGRVVAVAGDPTDRNVYYFGAVAGGIWKTTDGGITWECVSDGYLRTSSVGALAVAPSDPQILYAGMGETTIRIDVSHGDGVYRSDDGGRSWQHRGLAATRHIGKVRVHPTDPDTVYVAALGHAFGPNPERGVFRSRDGGRSWQHVLDRGPDAGAVDLTLDRNPRIMYAAIWEARRSFWQISSGGAQSGLWRSLDGGDTWEDLSRRPGLPVGLYGKIGVSAAPTRSGRVWALIEHRTHGGMYRSDDYGMTWERVSDNQHLVSRAWYYTHVTADPTDAETVYVNNLSLWVSHDGGRNYREIGTPHGDNHDIWIDPADGQRIIQGNDGGACVSTTGGAVWTSVYNQPTAQFYHLAADNRVPYTVYGTQQDNTSIAVPSRSPNKGILWGDCHIAGTGESGYIVVHPDDPDIIYVGAIGSSPGGGNCLQRYDHRTRQIRLIANWPVYMGGHGASEYRYRFNWTYPIVVSPHDSRVLYIGSNQVLRSTDEGQTWQEISPDLSRADPATLQPTGGPVNRDSIGAEMYATVFALVESPHEPGVLWAGSDDGLIHITRDGGATWLPITPPDLPEWALISGIELSPFAAGTAYVAATRYKLDDPSPYLYRTRDHGATWDRIDAGIPRDEFTRVIRTDPARPGVLYVGTETGLYLSRDDGASWMRHGLNLPVSPVHEILVHQGDLIVGTHGRSIWVFDDVARLHAVLDADLSQPQLFAPRVTPRVMPGVDWSDELPGVNTIGTTGGYFVRRKNVHGEWVNTMLDVGENPPVGVVLGWFLPTVPTAPIELTIKHADGAVLRTFRSLPAEGAPADYDERRDPAISARAGFNRFEWDGRHAPLPRITGKDPAASRVIAGAMVPPGQYRAELRVADATLTCDFELVPFPGITASAEDLQAQYRLTRDILERVAGTVQAINTMRELRGQLDGWMRRVSGDLAEQTKAVRERVLAIESMLLIPDLRDGWADNLNQGVRLLEQIATLVSFVEVGDYPPTASAHQVLQALGSQIDAQHAALAAVIDGELQALNAALVGAGHAPIIVAR